MVKFSIIIPVYNTEKYIEKCLNSVTNQFENDCEVIIVDDGSSDQSIDIVNNLITKNKYDNIAVVHQQNSGLSAARNTGLINATGEYIIWLDSDDMLTNDALESLRKCALDKPDVIVSRISSYFEDTGEVKERSYFFKNEELVNRKEAIARCQKTKGFWFAAWCFVVKREFLLTKEIFFKDGIYHEDELWSPTVLSAANTVVFNNTSVYINTTNRQGSITTVANIKKSFDKLIVVNELWQLCSAEKDEYIKKFLCKRIFLLLYRVFVEMDQFVNTEDGLTLKNAFNENLRKIYAAKAPSIKLIYRIRKTL